jgi:serine/threonine protein kinase
MTDDSTSDGVLTPKARDVEVMQLLFKGGGSGAQIYAARVDGWGCVMKSIAVESSSAREMLALSNEISVLENLPPHPNLLRYLFHRALPGRFEIFVTQYECTLAKYIHEAKKSGKEISLKETCRFLMDIVKGLSALHERKLIHRDLKPDNIFVTLNTTGAVERLAVGDFDTAKEVGGKAAVHTVVGTPGYMAPEVLTNSKYSFPVDVFGFGMCLYQLVEMERPFYEEANAFTISQRIITGQMPKLSDEGSCPQRKTLAKLYNKCVHVKPAKRPKLSAIKSTIVKIMVDQ